MNKENEADPGDGDLGSYEPGRTTFKSTSLSTHVALAGCTAYPPLYKPHHHALSLFLLSLLLLAVSLFLPPFPRRLSLSPSFLPSPSLSLSPSCSLLSLALLDVSPLKVVFVYCRSRLDEHLAKEHIVHDPYVWRLKGKLVTQTHRN